MVAPSFQPCWQCVEKGCAMPLMECAQDCACNKSFVSAISCVNGGGTPISCFTPALMGGGDSNAAALSSCLLQASSDCACQVNSPGGGGPGPMPSPPDASAGCTMTGGGSTSGNGACSSTIQETCGGTDYQAVCACPQARCVCFGETTTVIPIKGCPYCPSSVLSPPAALTPEQVFSLCGFPQ